MTELGFESIEGLRISDALTRGFAADGIICPTEVQRAAIPSILAGATMGPQAEALSRRLMGVDPIRTRTNDAPLLTHIIHSVEIVSTGAASDICLARYLKRHKCRRALVFVNRPNLIRHLYRHLLKCDLNPVSLSPERSKQQRRQAIAGFRKDKTSVLLATDSAARGLDLPELEWVLHYELPPSAEAYLHRAGRTGRAGRRGHSVVLVSASKRYLVERYAKELGIKFF